MALNKVTQGQEFIPVASTWNAFVDAANYVSNNMVNTGSDAKRTLNQTGIILVKNTTGSTIEPFSVVALKTVMIEPKNDASKRTFQYDMPFFEIEAYTEDTSKKPVAIVQEPIKKNATGKAMVLGVTAAKVNIDNEEHYSAVPDVKNKFKLKSASDGDIKILWKPAQTGEQLCMLAIGVGGMLSYKGMFKLTLENNSIKITNGADAESSNAGFVMVNGEYKDVPVGTVSSSSGYVVLKATVSGDSYNTSYEIKSDLTADESTGYYALGYVKTSTGGGGIEVFQYYHATPIILIVGNCKKENTQA